MKKFTIGILGVILVSICLIFGFRKGKEKPASVAIVKNEYKENIADSSLRVIAEMVWELGMTDKFDVEKSEDLNSWYDHCEQAMLNYYDSVNPGSQMVKEKKIVSVLNDLESCIEVEYTTISMISHSNKVYSVLMFRVVGDTRRVLQSDSCFVDEIEAWEELYGLLGTICMGVMCSEWYGGSGCIPMMGVAQNNVLEVRVNDLHRIIQLEGGSDPATVQMITFKKNELYEAMDQAIKTIDHDVILQDVKKCKDALPAALEKWIQTRSKYKGCTAIAIDDMKDAVNNSHSDTYDEEKGD